MNKYLLDTHYLIWIMKNPENINKKILDILKNNENEIYVSLASLWEIAIKQKIGKIEFFDNLENFKKDVESINIIWLPILDNHIYTTLDLTLYTEHKDPFDRLIIAQAKFENLILITNDDKFLLYKEIEVLK